MNNFVALGAGGGVVGVVALLFYILWQFISKAMVEATVQKTEDEDKSLQQQQLENQQKLAQVNKDLAALYAEREKLRNQYMNETDQERADSWNKPSGQS